MVHRYKEEQNANKVVAEALAHLATASAASEAYRQRDYRKAAAGFERVEAGEKDPAKRAAAAVYLGLSLQELHENEKAEAALSRALERRCHISVLDGVAAWQLGVLRMGGGDVAGARTAYEIALDIEDPHFVCAAAINLGTLEDEHGSRTRARSLWEYAFSSGSPDQKEYAAQNLGWFWEQSGDLGKACEYYELAARSADSRVRKRARGRLQELASRRSRG